LSAEQNNESLENCAEPVRVLRGVLGLFTTAEIGQETEAEVKIRRELNEAVHRMLILGLILSTSVLFVGLALSVITHQPVPSKVESFEHLFIGIKKGSPSSILCLGILLLITTPVLRVIGSLIEFIDKRDWRYALVTSVVLIVLAAGVFIGSR
jgi:uncharacterized membrane protein